MVGLDGSARHSQFRDRNKGEHKKAVVLRGSRIRPIITWARGRAAESHLAVVGSGRLGPCALQ